MMSPTPPAASATPPPSTFSFRPNPASLRRWLVELFAVFLGVYAAFVLNAHQTHR